MTYEEALEILFYNVKQGRVEAYNKLSELIKLYESESKELDLLALRAEIIDKYGILDYFSYKLSVTPQYITNVLSGRTNLTKKLLSRINALLRVENPSKAFVKKDIELIKKLNELTEEILKGELK